jgi:uncharacterized protein YgbK (DUF1537 family)
VSQTEGKARFLRENLPGAAEVLAGQPDALPDDEALRGSTRAMRAEDGLLLGVLDDDPTGSQAVHDVQVVTVLEEDAYAAAFGGPSGTCFVLTNTRSLDEPAAVEMNDRAARGLITSAERTGAGVQLVSRSDSTLRGHVMAEVAALQSVCRDLSGQGFDGVLLVPAFLEAGRVTAGDIHWARLGGELVPVGQTEFARDAAFGYEASDLRDFVAEKSRGAVRPGDVRSISLTDIRTGGPSRVRDLLAGIRDGRWVVVNATEYSDLDIVAHGVLAAERAGRSFLFRTGPSFVRALLGMGPKAPLRGEQIWSPGSSPGTSGDGRPSGHGLVVVGSHVGQTSRQVAALHARGGVTGVELDVPALVRGDDVIRSTAWQVAGALERSDVLLYTSRTVVPGRDPAAGLAIARVVSAALSRIVRDALAASPAWIVAKGGITSHDVAVHGLGIRRAEVTGQLFPGVISVFRPLDAAPEAIGRPYVVFAGNVGDEETLGDVVAILNGEQDGW